MPAVLSFTSGGGKSIISCNLWGPGLTSCQKIISIKSRSMGPEPIWPHIKIGVNVLFMGY